MKLKSLLILLFLSIFGLSEVLFAQTTPLETNASFATYPTSWTRNSTSAVSISSSRIKVGYNTTLGTNWAQTGAMNKPVSVKFTARFGGSSANNMSYVVRTYSDAAGSNLIGEYTTTLITSATSGVEVTIPFTNGEATNSTVYIRFLNLKATSGSSNFDIYLFSTTVYGQDAPTAVLTVSPSTLSAFTYAQGLGASSPQSFTVSGTTLTSGDITVTAPANFEVSTSAASGFGSTVLIPETGTLAATTVYARLAAGLTQSATPYTGDIIVSGGAALSKTVSLSGTVTAPTIPTLSITPNSLSALNYPIGAGPSAAQIFTVSGALLDGTAVTARVTSANFEVSLSPSSGFAQNITITSAAGTLASTPVYVRLKSGISSISPYSDTFYLEGGGASTFKLPISGAVIPTPLAAPTVGIPPVATEDGFTANWTVVPNATGYIVNVYNSIGSTLVKSVNVSGQTTNNVVVNGLAGSTAYTYKVVAVGDGINYSNSTESGLSQVITTLVAGVLVTPPCAITRYQTEFTDWDAVVSSSSDVLPIGSNGGAGFSILKAEVKPTTSVASNLGVFNITSTGGFTTKPIDFLGGGNVIVEVVASSNKTLTLTEKNSGAAGIIGSYEVQAMPAATISGNVATLASGAGIYKINFALAASTFTGTKTLSLMSNGGGISILSVTICSGKGLSPVLTTYPQPEKPLSMSAIIGGNTNTAITQLLGYNLTADATLSIVDDEYGSFSLPVTTVAAATAANGKNIAVTFKSSLTPSIHHAKLKISSTGAADVFVDLTGVSLPAGVTTNPVIIASTDSIQFASSLFGHCVRTLDLSALNLTGPVSITFQGAGKEFFSTATTSITMANILNGTGLDINYTGDLIAGKTNASLKLSSPGAADVIIPLTAVTLDQKPVFYTVDFKVTPSGTGEVLKNYAGNTFLVGTVLNIQLVAASNYGLSYWDDLGVAGVKSMTRNVKMTSNKGVITAIMAPGIVPCTNCGGGTSDFQAYNPLPISQTSFEARWAVVPSATSYIVTVYDSNGIAFGAPITVNGATAASTPVIGLNPGSLYSYKVQASTGADSGIIGPFKTLSGPVLNSCQ